MYRVLIADDDAIIRRGLRKTIEWESHGMEIVGVACDGQEALAMLKELGPHLLLTDIKMPQMSGIELMKEARRLYPDIQVILLTAYEDFEYAKEAIKHRACDYLLKPLAREELLESVLNAKKLYESRMRDTHRRNKSIPLLNRQFVNDLMAGYYSKARIEETIQELGLKICKENLIALDLLIVEYYDKSRELWGELLKYAVYNCVQELGQSMDICEVEVFQGNADHVYVILSSRDMGCDLGGHAAAFAGKIRKTIREVLDVETALGIGSRYSGMERMKDSIQEAYTALKYRHLSEQDGYSVFHEAVSWESGKKAELLEGNKPLIQKVLLGNCEQALEHLDQCRAKVLREGITLGNLRMWCIGLTAHLLQETGNWSRLEGSNDYYEYCDRICASSDLPQIFGIVAALIRDICAGVNETQADSKTVLAHKAETYIRNNYSDSELSLNDVAEKLHVSPVYLSILFKKIKQVTFSDFLSEIRMEAARELVEHTGLKTYEIGERVGYVNANYFSCLFKRRYHVSVSEHRKNIGGSGGRQDES